MTIKRKHLKYFAFCVLCTFFLVLFYHAYKCISAALEAERILLDGCLVIELLEDFIEDKGEWPKSWKDMESLRRFGSRVGVVMFGRGAFSWRRVAM